MFRFFAAFGLAVMLAGCATGGKKVTEAQVASIEQGKTTQAELIASLGQPTHFTHRSDGTKVLGWAYAHVGFAGIGNETQGLIVVIGADGIVKSYTRSGSKP
ncbi:hypothetical protein CXK93_12355 [Stutzerimonas decontaminans]|uniref:Lipoprotein SmpA/OmlA domain-containing protein n=1 Tax=Stutzerimonas decontaminans TaxID=3022791 RepID=A0ABX4W114_9GAMM|nr:hypothetical protein [Stutzerimonas decontaminans]MCQ4245555.1 hypothetical protein [Stutzerimonas decontaminans]PNF85055.1 hypothetical protein CXK93_12355 [Stutzerimonas decontaminans]